MSGNWDEAAQVMPQQLDADSILRTLVEHAVDFVVIGGLAVAAHGFARATKHIDIVPAPEPQNRPTRGGNWALRTTSGRVDILQWVPGIESYDELRSRALEVDLPDVGRVLFAGYQDLVAMKKAAGRPEDVRDLEELRAIRAANQ